MTETRVYLRQPALPAPPPKVPVRARLLQHEREPEASSTTVHVALHPEAANEQ